MFQLIKSCTGKWRGNDCPARARECWFVRSSESKIRSRFRPFMGGEMQAGRGGHLGLCLMAVREQAGCCRHPNFGEVTKSRPQEFLVLLCLMGNRSGGEKKKLFLKMQHPRRARPYFLIPVVNHPVISPSVLLSRKSKEGRREGNAIQFVLLADSVNTSIFSSLKFTLILLTEVCSAVFGFHF